MLCDRSGLTKNEPIHYYILPPRAHTPAINMDGLREAKYQLVNSQYCYDKAISYFREIAKRQEEGFELTEDLKQLDI